MEDLRVEIRCDTTELDAAIEKMNILIQLATRAKEVGVNVNLLEVTVGVGMAAVIANPRVSRRALFGLPDQRYTDAVATCGCKATVARKI